MGKATLNLQDSFLNQVRKENLEVKVVLVDGTMLIGRVRGFDNFTLILDSRGNQHLVYKHAVAQVVSRRDSRTPEQKNDRNSETDKKPQRFNSMDFSNLKSKQSVER